MNSSTNNNSISSATVTSPTNIISISSADFSNQIWDVISGTDNNADNQNSNADTIIQDLNSISDSQNVRYITYPVTDNRIEDTDLLNLLKCWNLERLYDHFLGKFLIRYMKLECTFHFIILAEKINLEILKIVKVRHLEKLFRTIDLGTQILFENCLETWRKSIGYPIEFDLIKESSVNKVNYMASTSRHSTLSPISSPRSSPLPLSRMSPYPQSHSPTSTKENGVHLSTILSESQKGIMLTEYYDQNKSFKEEHRIMMINLKAHYFDNHNIHLSLGST